MSFTGGALGNIVDGMRKFDADERIEEKHKWAGETHDWAGTAAKDQHNISALNLENLHTKQADDKVYRDELEDKKMSPGKAQALKLRGELLPYQDEFAYRKGLSDAKDENGKALNLSVAGERVKNFQHKVITEEQARYHQQAIGNLQSTLRDYIITKNPANLMKAFEAVPELKGEDFPAFNSITGKFTVKHNGKSMEVEPDAVFESLIKSVPHLQHPDNWLKLMQKKEETQATRKHAIDMSERGLRNSKKLASHNASLKTGSGNDSGKRYVKIQTSSGEFTQVPVEAVRKENADIAKFLKNTDSFADEEGTELQRMKRIAADKTKPDDQRLAQLWLSNMDAMYGAPAKGGSDGGANPDKQAYFKILDMVDGDKAKAREIMSLRAGSN